MNVLLTFASSLDKQALITEGVIDNLHLLKKNLNILIDHKMKTVISMLIFSLGGSTFGMSEETIPLYTIFISLMFVLKFDSITAILILFLGTQIGYVGSTLNPFSVLIAQGVSGIQGNPQL
jgi:uncharacterized ion transporter superfamily protein YfcC